MAPVLRRTLPFIVALVAVGVGSWLVSTVPADVGRLLEEPENGRMGDWLLGATQPGRWLVAMGLLLVLLAAARAVRNEPLRRRGPWLGLALAVGLAVTTVTQLALHGKRFELPVVGPVWALDDDMMITLRYARNLAGGAGLVWNPGERVEGITNFLWALLLAIPHWFLGPERVAAAAIALNVALLAAALFLLARLVRQLGGSAFAATLAAVALATHQATLHWAAGGSEAILLATLFLALANLAFGPALTPRGLWMAALVGGLAVLTRPDGAIAAGVLIAAIALRGSRREGLLLIAGFAALPVAQLLFRLGYYGELLPNTYHLKMTGWDGRVFAGLEYLVRLLSQHGIPVVLACAALLALRRRAVAAVLAAVALHLAYVVHAGGDELPKQRFFVPVAPLLFGLSALGVEQLAVRICGRIDDLVEPLSRSAVAAFQPLFLPVGALFLAGLGGGILPGQADPGGTTRALAERDNVLLGYLIRANTDPDAKVAHFWAGATAYFSERQGIDFLGKCDRVIARQAAKPGLMRPGHNKYDFDHSLGLAPDVVVSALPGRLTAEVLDQGRRAGPYRAFCEIYFAPGFIPHYLGAIDPRAVGNPALMPTLVGGTATRLADEWAEPSRARHALFVRVGSKHAEPPPLWKAPVEGPPR